MRIKVITDNRTKLITISKELKALFWAVVNLLMVLAGSAHMVYGLFIWEETARSAQHLVAGLVFFYLGRLKDEKRNG